MRSVNPSVDEVVAGLDRDGYALVPGFLSQPELEAARRDMRRVVADTPGGRNPFEGAHTKRVYALFAKTRAFDGPATHPLVLGVLDRVLGHCQLERADGHRDRPRGAGPGAAPRRRHLPRAPPP